MRCIKDGTLYNSMYEEDIIESHVTNRRLLESSIDFSERHPDMLYGDKELISSYNPKVYSDEEILSMTPR